MIKNILKDEMFSWAGNPRTIDSLKSQRVRFTYKEYVKVIKPRLWFN